MKSRFVTAAALLLAALTTGAASADSIALNHATATYSQSGFDVSAAIDGSLTNNTGWAIDPLEANNQSATFFATTPVANAGGTFFTFTLSQLFPSPDMHTIGKFKLSVSDNKVTWNDLSNVTFAAVPSETPVSIAADGTILLKNTPPSTATYTVTGNTNLASVTAFKLDVLTDPSLPNNGPGRQPINGNFVLTEFQVDGVATPLPATAVGGLVLLAGLFAGTRASRRPQMA